MGHSYNPDSYFSLQLVNYSSSSIGLQTLSKPWQNLEDNATVFLTMLSLCAVYTGGLLNLFPSCVDIHKNLRDQL